MGRMDTSFALVLLPVAWLWFQEARAAWRQRRAVKQAMVMFEHELDLMS